MLPSAAHEPTPFARTGHRAPAHCNRRRLVLHGVRHWPGCGSARSSGLGGWLSHGGDANHGGRVRALSRLDGEASRLHTGAMPTSLMRGNRWWRFRGSTPSPIARGFPPPPARTIGCPRKRSGSGLRAVAPRAWLSPGAMIRRRPVLATMTAGRRDRSRWDNRSPTPTVYLRCARTSTSGAAIGLQPATTRSHLSGTRRERKRAAEKHRGAAPGGTISKSHDVRPVPAFLRNSNTRTMAFA